MADSNQILIEIAGFLENNLQEFIANIQEKPSAHRVAAELQQSLPLISQMKQWSDSLPEERFRSTINSILYAIDDLIQSAVSKENLEPSLYGGSSEDSSVPFVVEALLRIGPEMTVSKDRMSVHISVPSDIVHNWNLERLREGVKRQGIVNPDDDALAQALKKPDVLRRVAKGTPPKAGRDAYLQDCLGLDQLGGVPRGDSEARIDFKELDLFKNVVQGDVILQKEPATPGQDGVDVFGEPIPCRNGSDVSFPVIPFTKTSEDGLELIATIDGCAYVEDDQIKIVPTLDIKENVDYSTGNIQSGVSVVVQGNVLTGFKVESENDVIVKGIVEGGKLLAQGNIFLSGGVQGKKEAVIQAQKNIDAKFINEAHIIAQKDMIVHGPVILSQVRCRRLMMQGKETSIKGSVVEAIDDICADQIGSDIGAKTEIRMGYDIPLLHKKIAKLEEEIKSLQEKNKKFSDTIQTLDKIKKKRGKLPADKEDMYKKVINAREKAKNKIEYKEEDLAKTKQDLEESEGAVRMVRARSNIFPGVTIKILDQTLPIKSPTGPATVVLLGEQIKVLPYQDRVFETEGEE